MTKAVASPAIQATFQPRRATTFGRYKPRLPRPEYAANKYLRLSLGSHPGILFTNHPATDTLWPQKSHRQEIQSVDEIATRLETSQTFSTAVSWYRPDFWLAWPGYFIAEANKAHVTVLSYADISREQ